MDKVNALKLKSATVSLDFVPFADRNISKGTLNNNLLRIRSLCTICHRIHWTTLYRVVGSNGCDECTSSELFLWSSPHEASSGAFRVEGMALTWVWISALGLGLGLVFGKGGGRVCFQVKVTRRSLALTQTLAPVQHVFPNPSHTKPTQPQLKPLT